MPRSLVHRSRWRRMFLFLVIVVAIVFITVQFYVDHTQNARNQALLGNKTGRIFLWSKGRLGNQLFQYSMAWALQKRTGRQVYMVTDWDLKNMFPGLTVPILVPTWYLRITQASLPITMEERVSLYEENLLQRIPEGDVKLCCYFQSFKNFWPHKDQLRTELTFNDSIWAAANGVLRTVHTKLLGDDDVQNTRFVAVHARRGDLTNQFNYDLGYRPAEPSYFHEAMAVMRRKSRKRVLFIVASDDKGWAREHLQVGTAFLSLGRSSVEDLALLAACNDTISSMGTFSWWAAFLTPGMKVYFRDAMANGSESAGMYPVNDFFPPHWIPMGN